MLHEDMWCNCHDCGATVSPEKGVWSPVAGMLQRYQHLLVVSKHQELDILFKELVQVSLHSLDLQEAS